MTVLLVVFLFLLQALAAPDPAQMEAVRALEYMPVPLALQLPDGVSMGAPSSVAVTAQGGLLVFNRGPHPLIELDRDGRFVRAFGQGLYDRPHGMRIDAEGNVWTTDVRAHTVRKLGPRGDVLMVLASPAVSEPTDVAFGPGGDVFVVQGHGVSEPRVLRFDARGVLLTSWGGKGTGPGQFDIAHSIVVDGAGVVHVADRQNRRVQRFDLNGRFLGERKYLGLPCGLYIGADRQMYMVSGFAGQILELDADGAPAAAIGQAGKGLGEFGEAHYLTLTPGGDIYVADTVNARLHRFVPKLK
jgi:sugar lactone lactonase YvrE